MGFFYNPENYEEEITIIFDNEEILQEQLMITVENLLLLYI